MPATVILSGIAVLRLTDLREILRYVPHFRDRSFVIALDGAVVEDENFANLLLDIALLRSLRIGVALVHGTGHQLRQLADQAGVVPSNIDGTGVTDAATLQLAISAANRVSHEIIEGLATNDLFAATGNAVVAHPAGILAGVDHLYTGRVDRVETAFLTRLLENDIVPIIPPLGIDGEGRTWRLNSDAVAVEVAKALRAVKLIYLTVNPSVRSEGRLVRQLAVEEAEQILRRSRGELTAETVSKLEQAVRAAKGGVPRVHIIDGRLPEGLLAEVFSNEGVGTLVHANEYQSIRKARKRDARLIYGLIQGGVASEELLPRSRADIEQHIGEFFVFEVDRHPIACAALRQYASEGMVELECVYVDARFENQGIGARLIQYAEGQARTLGASQLFCLSTQAFNFFTRKGGFHEGSPEDLPPSRRTLWEASGRNSKVLIKTL